MLSRLLPVIGTLLLSRGTRRVAGKNAGKLALALGAWELWRNYKRSKAPTASNPSNGSYGAYPPRRGRRGGR